MRRWTNMIAFNGGVFSLWTPTPFRGPEAFRELVPRLAALDISIPEEGIEITNRFKGRTYGCGNQYVMAAKAWLARDIVALQKIQASSDPREQEAIARTIQPFDARRWDRATPAVAVSMAIAKFSSSTRLTDEVLDTGSYELVNGSPNRIWGVGIDWRDPAIQDRTAWRGRNLLGTSTMEARTVLAARGTTR